MFMAIPAYGRADGPLDKLKLGLATTQGTARSGIRDIGEADCGAR
jgi:hypothetical protein